MKENLIWTENLRNLGRRTHASFIMFTAAFWSPFSRLGGVNSHLIADMVIKWFGVA